MWLVGWTQEISVDADTDDDRAWSIASPIFGDTITVNRQNTGGQNPRKIWPLEQKPGVDFQGGGHFLHLLFMEFILFNIVKSVDITRRCSACYKIYFISQGWVTNQKTIMSCCRPREKHYRIYTTHLMMGQKI